MEQTFAVLMKGASLKRRTAGREPKGANAGSVFVRRHLGGVRNVGFGRELGRAFPLVLFRQHAHRSDNVALRLQNLTDRARDLSLNLFDRPAHHKQAGQIVAKSGDKAVFGVEFALDVDDALLRGHNSPKVGGLDCQENIGISYRKSS